MRGRDDAMHLAFSSQADTCKEVEADRLRTAVFGKMHFNRPGESGLYGFDEMLTEREINQAWPRTGEPAGESGVAD